MFPGFEECDDGNGYDYDGCIDCKVAVCGDGVRNYAEEFCDDGNDNDLDACRTDCRRNNLVAAAQYHTCVVRNGAVWCWGNGGVGRLGYASTANLGHNAPLDEVEGYGPVDLGGEVLSIAARSDHNCAIRVDGSVVCWGRGLNGRLGQSGTYNIGDVEPPGATSVYLGPGKRAVEIGVGYNFSCALRETEDVVCWGHGEFGQLGQGVVPLEIGDDEDPFSDGLIEFEEPVRSLTVGWRHACVLLEDRSIHCWGYASHGQLGLGNKLHVGDNEQPHELPPPMLGPTDIAEVRAGGSHSCALLTDGALMCWGYNLDGQLGLGMTENVGDTETPMSVGLVPLAGRVKELFMGHSQTCARLDSPANDVICWGRNNFGQLGYPHYNNLGDTELVDRLPGVSFFAGDAELLTLNGGVGHTCALSTDGLVSCWGEGIYGKLGSGSQMNTLNGGSTVALP